MVKIIVTGSTGFIGKRLIYQLLEEGHEIYALTRIKGTGLKIASNPPFPPPYGDLQDPSTMDPFPEKIEAGVLSCPLYGKYRRKFNANGRAGCASFYRGT